MTKIFFRDRNGQPLAGAVVAITTAPAEMTDLGYVTGDDGSIALTLPTPGSYGFTLTSPDGSLLIASKELQLDSEATATAHAMG